MKIIFFDFFPDEFVYKFCIFYKIEKYDFYKSNFSNIILTQNVMLILMVIYFIISPCSAKVIFVFNFNSYILYNKLK